MLIEQAIFTSAQSDHAVGYHLVARSPGVQDADARELTVWGPSHDSLETASGGNAHGASGAASTNPASINFFCLPSGASCISKTQMAGQEYSGRGLRTYTHYLVVPPDVLLRFANNPFALLRAAWAKDLLQVCDDIPKQLVPFELAGRAEPVDEGLIGQLVAQCGPPIVGRLIEAVLENKPVVLLGVRKAEATVAGLLNLLPLSCRPELSFTTGLRYSARRPFHLMIAAQETSELRRWSRQGVVTVVDMVPQSVPVSGKIVGGWGGYVCELLERDELSTLVAQLIERPQGLRLENLNELGEQLRHQAPASSPAATKVSAKCNRTADPPARSTEPREHRDHRDQRDQRDKAPRRRGDRPRSPQPASDLGATEDDFLAMLLSGQPATDDVRSNGQAHHSRHDDDVAMNHDDVAVHDDDVTEHDDDVAVRRDDVDVRDKDVAIHGRDVAPEAQPRKRKGKRQTPATLLDTESPAVLAQLEKLDDVVFDAINGDGRAMDEVAHLWPQLAVQLAPEQLDLSREQYLRYALSLWESSLDQGLRDPNRAVASLHVLSVLFSDR